VRERARGLTLVELLVVLMIIGLTTSVVALALGSATRSTETDSLRDEITAARDSAIRTSRPVTERIGGSHGRIEITALPDGRVIADSALSVDRLSGDSDVTR